MVVYKFSRYRSRVYFESGISIRSFTLDNRTLPCQLILYDAGCLRRRRLEFPRIKARPTLCEISRRYILQDAWLRMQNTRLLGHRLRWRNFNANICNGFCTLLSSLFAAPRVSYVAEYKVIFHQDRRRGFAFYASCFA